MSLIVENYIVTKTNKQRKPWHLEVLNPIKQKNHLKFVILIKYVLKSSFTKVLINKKEKINLVSFFLCVVILFFYFVVLYFNTINIVEEAY